MCVVVKISLGLIIALNDLSQSLHRCTKSECSALMSADLKTIKSVSEELSITVGKGAKRVARKDCLIVLIVARNLVATAERDANHAGMHFM